MNFIRKTMKRMSKSLPPKLNHNDFAFGTEAGPRPFRNAYSLQPAERANYFATFNAPIEVQNDVGDIVAGQQAVPPAHDENHEPHTEDPDTSASGHSDASEVEQVTTEANQDAQEIKQEEEDNSISENGHVDLREADEDGVAASPEAQEQNPPVVPQFAHNTAQLTGTPTPSPTANEPSRMRRALPLQRNGAHANLASMNRYDDMDLDAQRALQARERQIRRTQQAYRAALSFAQEIWTLLQEQLAEHAALRHRITQAQAQAATRRIITNAELAEMSRNAQVFDERMQSINERMAAQGQRSLPVAGPSQPPVQRAASPSPEPIVKSEPSSSRSPSPSGSNKRAREDDEPAPDGAEPRFGRRTRIRREVVAEPQPVRRSARIRALATRPAQEVPPPPAQPRSRPPNSDTPSLCIGSPAESPGQPSRKRKRSRTDAEVEVEDEDEAPAEEATGKPKSKRSKRSKRRRT